MKMKRIESNKILFIKLGQSGEFEKECIENNQTLRLGYCVFRSILPPIPDLWLPLKNLYWMLN